MSVIHILKERFSSKLIRKSKSKNKDKDRPTSPSSIVFEDQANTNSSDSDRRWRSLSSSAIPSRALSANNRSNDEGIQFIFHLFSFFKFMIKNKINIARKSSIIFSSTPLTFKYPFTKKT